MGSARLVLGILGLLAVTAAVVHLAVTSTSPRTSPSPEVSRAAPLQPITTPIGPVEVGPREGARAPVFSAPLFSGGILTLTDLRGKGVVMNFFASWCAPCRAEARDLEAAYRRYRDRGIVFLGVDVEQDTWSEAREFLNEFGITYPAVHDERGEIAQKYQLFGLPTTYFIDRNGVIRSKFVGPFRGPEGVAELERRITMVLPEP